MAHPHMQGWAGKPGSQMGSDLGSEYTMWFWSLLHQLSCFFSTDKNWADLWGVTQGYRPCPALTLVFES